jgi:hypothetical protein
MMLRLKSPEDATAVLETWDKAIVRLKSGVPISKDEEGKE